MMLYTYLHKIMNQAKNVKHRITKTNPHTRHSVA